MTVCSSPVPQNLKTFKMHFSENVLEAHIWKLKLRVILEILGRIGMALVLYIIVTSECEIYSFDRAKKEGTPPPPFKPPVTL